MMNSFNTMLKSWKSFRYCVKGSARKTLRKPQLTRAVHSGELKTAEIQIPMPYGHLAAKVWGSKGPPVLAIHGWQDNCGTFDRLIPLLPPSYQYFALDLPGHGWSSHRPPGCFYTFLSMNLEMRRVFDYFKWEKINIIAHSMGGQISLLWSGIYPETVNKLVLLDTVKPFSVPMDKLMERYETSIQDNLIIEKKLASGKFPVYTPEAAAKRYAEGVSGEVTEDIAKILMKRGTKESPNKDGVVFTRDLRLRTIEYFNIMSHEAARSFASRIACELLVIRAKNCGQRYKTHYPEESKKCIEIYKKNCKRFILEDVEGNHFVHLNDPHKISPIVSTFLNT